MSADLVVVGGGLGGVAAALTAADLGLRVILTEATHRLGGQVSTQAVPPDEHPWIEGDLTSPSYRRMREAVRAYYRRNYPLLPEAHADTLLNPGLGFVSRLCAEPRVYAAVLEELLAPHVASGRVRVLREHTPTDATSDGDDVTSVTVRCARTGADVVLVGAMYADATELGDLLPLAGVEHVFGAESAAETGELHAPDEADWSDQQALSWCFAVEYRPGEDHTIERPASYEHWRTHVDSFWPGPQLSWEDVEPITLARRTRPIFDGDTDAARVEDLWHYRRMLARTQFEPGYLEHDVSLVNWPQIDYWAKPILGVGPEDQAAALAEARQLSLSFLHWMQTEAPRPDGGTGYPGLRPRGDLLDSDDMLAIAPYVRESRRIRALLTVTEAHIGREMRGEHAGSELFPDSVGIGYYRIDLHPSTSGRTYVDIACFPFQIPLGALVPVRVRNLLPANKNIGSTHITNGAYRLHPVEWSIGEAVGALAAHCKAAGATPQEVWNDPVAVRDLQEVLTDRLGLSLAWPDDIRTGATLQDHVPVEDTQHVERVAG
jgi:hypothetical protein